VIELARFLDGNAPTVVTTHIRPDGDALGALLAVTEFLGQRDIPAIPVVDSSIPHRFSFLPGSNKIATYHALKSQKRYQRVIVLDVGSWERIGKVHHWIAGDAKVANIDHHLSNPGFGAVNILRTECSATTEILWDIAQEFGFEITPDIATHLYTGILTDTGRFQFSNTTARAFAICSQLVELGAQPESIAKQVYFDYSIQDVRKMGKLLGNVQLLDHGRISAIRLKRINEVEDTDSVLDMALSIQGVEIAILIAPIPGGKSKVSLRSKQYVDVRKIAEKFGGGGHTKASGFRFRIDPDEMQDQLLPVLIDALGDMNGL
jgi:phosphoesterase RecJ-like protein